MLRKILLLIALILMSPAAFAQEMPKPDDTVGFSLSAEDWVTTKTAHVTLNVEAAVSAATAGTMRADMIKAVGDVAKGDWRLVGFNRSQDQTGLDRWSASFESRLPESDLGGLADAAKKASKAGMQITVGDVDFTPTLDETEAVRTTLRARLYKQATDQLAALNAALPGRGYRIAQISFDDADNAPPPPRMMHRPMVMMAGASAAPAPAPEMEHSEKLTMNAQVVYAAVPPAH